MNKRILILDDNNAILDVVTETLVYGGFEVLDISLGSLFFDSVHDFKPDLILLDYKLADTNGGDLCTQLKRSIDYKHIPIIIFSAYFIKGDFNQPADCDGILYKPFDMETLLEIVQIHLRDTVEK